MRLSSQNLVATVGFALMAAAACLFISSSHFIKPLNVLFFSVTTEATLDDQYQERTSRRKGITTTGYNVSYSFVANGKTYRGASAIDNPPSKIMTVAYLPDQPGINGLDLRTFAWINLVIFLVPLGVLLASILALVAHIRGAKEAAPQKTATGRTRVQWHDG